MGLAKTSIKRLKLLQQSRVSRLIRAVAKIYTQVRNTTIPRITHKTYEKTTIHIHAFTDFRITGLGKLMSLSTPNQKRLVR